MPRPILRKAAPIAQKENDKFKHKERMSQLDRFNPRVPLVMGAIITVAAAFLIEIVGVAFLNG